MQQDPASARPTVSVIVPARNEEVCLGTCLQSLVDQSGIHFEIIVVDDGSTDRTRQIAESFAGVQIISPPPLPQKWTGKNNALIAATKIACGEWLLFTDADTVHLPGSLAHALTEAKQQGVALLSYSPEQEVHGFWEKAVMPVIFAELATQHKPAQVSDSGALAAAANGQYILVSRRTYDAVGGHAAIASNLLEDVALARAVKASGAKIYFRYGGDAVRTRMYRSFMQLREGWTKNLILLFPAPTRLALVRSLEFSLIIFGALLTFALGVSERSRLALLAAALVAILYGVFLKRILKAHFPVEANILALFGLPLFSYLILRSKAAHARGWVSWKGRNYDSTALVSQHELSEPLATASL